MNQETQMQSDAQSVVEIFLNYENYDDDLKYIFRKKKCQTFWRTTFATS